MCNNNNHYHIARVLIWRSFECTHLWPACLESVLNCLELLELMPCGWSLLVLYCAVLRALPWVHWSSFPLLEKPSLIILRNANNFTKDKKKKTGGKIKKNHHHLILTFLPALASQVICLHTQIVRRLHNMIM